MLRMRRTEARRNEGSRSNPVRAMRAAACIGLLLAVAGSVPAAAAATVFDADIAERIKGLAPTVRDHLREIERETRAKLMAVLARHGIDPAGPLKMNAMMKAAKDLEAVAREEREAVLPLLKPEERAQYHAIVAETTQRVRNAVK